jgi:tryptophanyl-tRNA synthetase
MITPLPWFERVPTYKSKIEELKGKDLGTYGFLGYPVLQAADILMYKADFVPVGQDQLPHIELTREIARRFNDYYKKIFKEPQGMLTEYPVILGVDGRKMSKSYGNSIAISDSPEVIAKKVSLLITDPARIRKEDKGHPEVCTAYGYYKIFSTDYVGKVAEECKEAKRGCVACKKELAERLLNYLAPIHQKRKELEKDMKLIKETLARGAEKAKKVASATLLEVKEAIGLL